MSANDPNWLEWKSRAASAIAAETAALDAAALRVYWQSKEQGRAARHQAWRGEQAAALWKAQSAARLAGAAAEGPGAAAVQRWRQSQTSRAGRKARKTHPRQAS
jgi:hypothetical protein